MFRCSLDPEELMMRDKHNDVEDEDEDAWYVTQHSELFGVDIQ